MKCPNCGYNRQKRDDAFVPATECPSCGIVYSKHEGGVSMSTTPSSTPLRPSAVDPESLKKAKERVEKRLRNRIEAPVRDERHAQTLDMARKLTGKAVRSHKKNEAQKKNLEKADVEDQNPSSNHDDAPSEDPLLLEDAIGVQLHSGQNDIVQKTLDDAMTAHETTSDDQENEMSTDAHADIAVTPKDENQNTVQTSAYPEDVQVETVRLESAEHIASDAVDDTTEPESWTTVEELDSEMEKADLPPAYIAAASTTTTPRALHAGGINLKRVLPIIAWLILFSGVIGAVLSWTTLSDVEAGVRIPGSGSSNALPIGLLLGFAYLATGALGFAFFWVSSLISKQLKDIRRLLMVHPISMYSEENGTDLRDRVNKDSHT